MGTDGTKRERTQTDQRLKSERDQADLALGITRAVDEEKADDVVRLARRTADAVLGRARDTADDRPPSRELLLADRARADEAVRTQRADADEALRAEREEERRLAQLLPLERELTNRSLLTERARSDDAVANRDDFLSMVSHDLRNLLAAIVTTADQLSMNIGSASDDARTVQMTGRIQRYSARMNRLIGDLLDVGSIDAGALSMASMPGDLATVLQESVESFQIAAAAKQLTLTLELDPSVSLVAEFDHERMLQVFANLLSNAIKFTPEGGAIRVWGERTPTELRIRIADTGIGIAPSMLPAIFERFWQAGKDDRRGIGLGLYIARSIAEAHGGTITVESRLGQGTTFTVVHLASDGSARDASQPAG